MHTARRATALLAALAGCLAAVAYAAVPGRPARHPEGARAGVPPAPVLTQHPDRRALSTNARFRFSVRGGRQRFQCRLDGDPWTACRSPVSLTKLSTGEHRFGVRAIGASGAHGRAARFRWRVLEPRDFAIAPRLSELKSLYPGAPAQSLPLTVSNPNPATIFVTSLGVAAVSARAGCASAENLELTGAGVSAAAPLRVPAHGSVDLPGARVAAPAIRLRDLPVNQDACQGASFALSFSGMARG